MTDHSELLRLAKEAVGTAWLPHVAYCDDGAPALHIDVDIECGNAALAFMRAASPDRIIALLEELAKARALAIEEAATAARLACHEYEADYVADEIALRQTSECVAAIRALIEKGEK